MGTTLSSWLIAGTALPADIESKFTALPPLSKGLTKIATMIPKGPAIFPNPPKLPVPDLSKIPNPPKIFGTPTKAKLPYPTLPQPGDVPPPAKPAFATSLATDIPSNTAKSVSNVYTGTGY